MTLFKQVAIAVSTIIVIMLAAVMIVNYKATKKDMIQSVYEASVNNIATLASNIAAAGKEEAYIITVIDAAFDSGYYKSIEFRSSSSDFTYKQVDNNPIKDVPDWFVKYATVELKTIKEDVSSGWESVGELHVSGDIAIIYKALYENFIRLIYLFIIFVLVFQLVLSFMLSFILRPLKEIQNQAEAITRDEFVIQDKIPYTTEFKGVVRGMNMMVKKVEYIFLKGSEALKRNQELLYLDPITKLYNRRYLLLNIPDIVALENRVNGGTLIFVGMSGAELLNQIIGREKTDKMFANFGEILLDTCKDFDDGIGARVNGTEFILLLPNTQTEQSLEIANEIYTEYEELLESFGVEKESSKLHIGIYKYKSNISVSELLTRADNALTQAKANEAQSVYVYEEKDDECAMGKEQWREILEKSIEQKHISLKFYSMVETRTKKAEHNVMTFTIEDKNKHNIFYGDFIAPAINLGLVSKLYMQALENLITNKHQEIENTLCSVRLSNEFIKDPLAYEALASLLKEHARNLNFKLAFEISDNFIVRNVTLVKRFIDLFKQYGCGFGINAFSGVSDDFSYLKEFKPQFLKADISFLLDQSEDSINSLGIITDSLGIKLIATFVENKEQLHTLNTLRIYRVQGPITDSITH